MENSYLNRLSRFNSSEQWNRCVNRLFTLEVNRNKVLDVGCGIGTFCSLIKEYFNKEVYGCDVNVNLLEVAQRVIGGVGFVQQKDGSLLPFQDNNFNWVTCIHTISHAEYPEALLCEIERVLLPGGVVTFVVPSHLFDVLMTPYNKLTGYEGDPSILHHWTTGSFKKMVEEAGFDSVSIEMFGEYAKGFPQFKMFRSWFICNARKKVYVGIKPFPEEEKVKSIFSSFSFGVA